MTYADLHVNMQCSAITSAVAFDKKILPCKLLSIFIFSGRENVC